LNEGGEIRCGPFDASMILELLCHQPNIVVETVNLLLDSFLVMVVAVVEKNQLEVLCTNSNSIAEEGRARVHGRLLAFQNVKVLSHLVCIETLALGGFQLNDVSVKPSKSLRQVMSSCYKCFISCVYFFDSLPKGWNKPVDESIEI